MRPPWPDAVHLTHVKLYHIYRVFSGVYLLSWYGGHNTIVDFATLAEYCIDAAPSTYYDVILPWCYPDQPMTDGHSIDAVFRLDGVPVYDRVCYDGQYSAIFIVSSDLKWIVMRPLVHN